MPRITFCRTRNRQPWRKDSSVSSSTAPCGGAGAIRNTAASDATKLTVSIAYVVPTPAAAISRPPRAGPTIAPVFE